MAKKSDKWIKNRSALSSFGVSLYYSQQSDSSWPVVDTTLEDLASKGLHASDLAMIVSEQKTTVDLTANSHLEIVNRLCEAYKHDSYGLPQLANFSFTGLRDMGIEHQLPLPMVYPFFNRSVSSLEFRGKTGKCPSYGLTSYGYDIRLGNRFKICHGMKSPGKANLLDFLTCDDTPDESHLYQDLEVDAIDLLPGQFMLGVSMEWVNVPNNVIATCMQKSSMARKGCMAFVTPLEPGWRGFITLEIVNHTEVTQRLYAGMGIMQLTFDEGDERCEVSYSDRGGKYMNQAAEPVLSKMQ
jgi:dCTP deaminase